MKPRRVIFFIDEWSCMGRIFLSLDLFCDLIANRYYIASDLPPDPGKPG
jgi:hypothetical protein